MKRERERAVNLGSRVDFMTHARIGNCGVQGQAFRRSIVHPPGTYDLTGGQPLRSHTHTDTHARSPSLAAGQAAPGLVRRLVSRGDKDNPLPGPSCLSLPPWVWGDLGMDLGRDNSSREHLGPRTLRSLREPPTNSREREHSTCTALYSFPQSGPFRSKGQLPALVKLSK